MRFMIDQILKSVSRRSGKKYFHLTDYFFNKFHGWKTFRALNTEKYFFITDAIKKIAYFNDWSFFILFYYYWLCKNNTPKHWLSLNFSASDKHSSLQSCNLSDKEITSIEITCCETFNSHNFQMGLISCRITPWQAFPAKSNVSGEPRSLP